MIQSSVLSSLRMRLLCLAMLLAVQSCYRSRLISETDGTDFDGGDVLGNGDTPPPVPEYVTTGFMHTCTLMSDGSVKCWGYNQGGESMPPTGKFQQISTGAYRSCGIRTDGTVACWGSDFEDHSARRHLPPIVGEV